MLAFNGVLAPILISAKDHIGRHLWIALFGLAVSVLMSLAATGHAKRGAEVGPRPGRFLESESSSTPADFDYNLLRYLRNDLSKTSLGAADSRKWLVNAVAFTGATLFYATYLALLS